MSVTITINCDTVKDALSEMSELLGGYGRSTATVTRLEVEPVEVAPEGVKKAQVTNETTSDGEVAEPVKKKRARRTKKEIEAEKAMAAAAEEEEEEADSVENLLDDDDDEIDHRAECRVLIDEISTKHGAKGVSAMSKLIKNAVAPDAELKVKNVPDDTIEGLCNLLVKLRNKEEV